ncbi:hypothetical protein GCM10010246_48690 [Streptomyces cuspidosporus]|uniref:Ig-like domain-containing protein n=1 Tax=Streptomyces cuspidosporus TaxID=66882 RepID=A0ABP5TKP2_9ACTN
MQGDLIGHPAPQLAVECEIEWCYDAHTALRLRATQERDVHIEPQYETEGWTIGQRERAGLNAGTSGQRPRNDSVVDDGSFRCLAWSILALR